MPYCNNCKLEIKANKCPLCFSELENKNNTYFEEYLSYDWYYKKIKKVNAKKIVSLVAVSAIIIIMLVNISTSSKYNWAMISAVSVASAYFTYICFTASIFYLKQKLLIEFFILLPLVIIIDIFSGFYKWSFNYVMPFLSLGLNISMLIIGIIDHKYFNEYVSYIISAAFISILMIVLPLFNFLYWTSLAAFGSGIIVILTMIILFRNEFILSLKKIFNT